MAKPATADINNGAMDGFLGQWQKSCPHNNSVSCGGSKPIPDVMGYKTAQEEAKRNQQRLIQADKMNSLGLMVSGVAHEINNPNNLIMLNADVMDTFWKHMRPVLRGHVEAQPDWKLAGLPYAIAEGANRIKRIVATSRISPVSIAGNCPRRWI